MVLGHKCKARNLEWLCRKFRPIWPNRNNGQTKDMVKYVGTWYCGTDATALSYLFW